LLKETKGFKLSVFVIKKIQQDATIYKNFILPYLNEAQHVLGNTSPIIRSLKLHWQPLVFHMWGVVWCADGGRSHSISSTIAAGSSISLTVPDTVCTVLCSWWWAEEPPKTCTAIYRNEEIEKMLHLVGCTLEIYLRCTDIWTSNLYIIELHCYFCTERDEGNSSTFCITWKSQDRISAFM